MFATGLPSFTMHDAWRMSLILYMPYGSAPAKSNSGDFGASNGAEIDHVDIKYKSQMWREQSIIL